MARKKVVITTDMDVYKKLKMLLYSDEVLFNNIHLPSIKRILKNVNSGYKILEIKNYDNHFTLQKINQANYDVYFKS